MREETKDNFIQWRMSIHKRKIQKAQKKYGKWEQKQSERIKETEELKTEYGKERVWQEKYIKSKAYWSVCVGALVLLLTMCLSYMCDISEWEEGIKTLCKTVITVLNSIFSIVIGMGISTLVLDFFSYVKYTRERIKEIMIDKKYIDTLSEEEKKNVIDICEKSLYFKNGELTDNSLYANIKESIVPLIQENYYKQYKVHVDCYVDEERGVIRKKVHKIMEIECMENCAHFRIPFSTYLTAINGVEDEELYKLEECHLGKEDITEKVKKCISNAAVENNESVEDVKFTIDYDFELQKGLNRIVIKSESVVPIEDNTYAHVITIPCKRYSVNFSLHNRNYDVLGFAYAFDDAKHKDSIDRVIYRDKYEDCFKIRFEDWTLPGDGVVFIVNKKKDDK